MAVQLLMMRAAQGHRELVADLAAERSWLRELEMVGIAGRLLADETGLVAHECEVRLVALARGFLGEGQPDAWLGDGLAVGRANSLGANLNRSFRPHRVSERKLVRRDADLARDGRLEPRLIGGFNCASVSLQEGVLERQAGPGPVQEVISARE
jgi:hypothetical protein